MGANNFIFFCLEYKTDARLVGTTAISASPDKTLACKSSGPETTSYSVSELSNCVFSYTSFERAAAGAPAGNTTLTLKLSFADFSLVPPANSKLRPTNKKKKLKYIFFILSSNTDFSAG